MNKEWPNEVQSHYSHAPRRDILLADEEIDMSVRVHCLSVPSKAKTWAVAKSKSGSD